MTAAILRRLFLTAAVLSAAVWFGCSTRPEKIVIGVALAEQNHPAVTMAIREINAAGGIRGVPVEAAGLEWKFRDLAAPAEILRWAEGFAQNSDLVAVIGHSDSSATLSAAAVYNQQQVPQIITIATSPILTKIGPWTYRLCLSDARQGPALARYAVTQWKKERIAVFYVNDDYGRGVAQQFEEEVRRLRGAVVSSVMHRNLLLDDDKRLIRSTLERLIGENRPQLFALFQRPDAARWTIGTIRSIDPSADILGGDSLGASDFVQEDAELMEGIRVSQFFLPDPKNPRTMKFVQDYRQFAGVDPGYGQAFAYDAVYLIRDAVLGAGFDRQDIKSYLDRLIQDGTVVDGVGGAYRLGPDHDGRRALFLTEAHAGSYRFLAGLPVE
jgi:branched-chain amino acid transport system substrate-binding protein